MKKYNVVERKTCLYNNKSKVQQIRIIPWFVATAENIKCTSNGYVHNFLNSIILGRFVNVKVVKH